MNYECKCGSTDFFIEEKGSQTGLYCSMCGKWQKWMTKDEIRLFNYNNQSKKPNNVIEEKCLFCKEHEKGDTLYQWSDWDGGIGFDYIRNILFCPLCGKELKKE